MDNESVANMLDDDDPNPPRCASCGVAWREHLGMQGTCAEVLRLRQCLSKFAGFVRTCRHDNTQSWMEALAERLNGVAEVLGIPKSFDTDGLDIYGDDE